MLSEESLQRKRYDPAFTERSVLGSAECLDSNPLKVITQHKVRLAPSAIKQEGSHTLFDQISREEVESRDSNASCHQACRANSISHSGGAKRTSLGT